MRISELHNRDVAVLGAGREGRAVWRAVRRELPALPLTFYCEDPPGGEFTGDFNTALDRIVVGPLDGEALARHEILIRSPGVSIYREELLEARRAGATFTTATGLWFAEHPQARSLCITGTKGKSTTAALAAHLLNSAGITASLGGNIGEPLLDCRERQPDWWVIELSSYQLADLEAQPSISVILNLSDAHLVWHGSPEAYRRDKLRIADLAGERPLVVNHADAGLRARLRDRAGVTWFGRADGYHVRGDALYRAGAEVARLPLPGLPGTHNLSNLAAALTALELAGVRAPAIAGALERFAPLPHRLQSLGTRDGVLYVNDSLSTTPVATVAALEAFAGRPVTLLLGGEESAVDWAEPIERMQTCPPHAIIALPDSGPALAESARAAGLAPVAGIHRADHLGGAVELARRLTPEGGIVLMSPGAPSFPHFGSYAERGEQFAGLSGFST